LPAPKNEAWLWAFAHHLASMSLDHGKPEKCERLATEALVLFRGQGDSGAVVYLHNVSANWPPNKGTNRAAALLEEALSINRTVTGCAWAPHGHFATWARVALLRAIMSEPRLFSGEFAPAPGSASTVRVRLGR
jgi:hypothetical protein